MGVKRGSFLFLGSGGAMGIPMVGCPCAVCHSSSLHNKRLRSSGLVRIGDYSLLIDVGPDFRQQGLNCALERLDGVLFTHAHSDHVAGIDDLRAFYFLSKRSLKCLASEATLNDLHVRVPYLFEKRGDEQNITAQLDFQILEGESGKTNFMGIDLSYFGYYQGKMAVTGYRFGDFAYVTDIKQYSEEIFEQLKGVKKLVVSASQKNATAVHLGLEEAVAFAERVGAEESWLTHISHRLDHEEGNHLLPEGVALAYDGLELNFLVE